MALCMQECQLANRSVTEYREGTLDSISRQRCCWCWCPSFTPPPTYTVFSLLVCVAVLACSLTIVPLKHKILHIHPLGLQTLEHGQSSLNNGPWKTVPLKCRQLHCNWKRPLMNEAECLTIGHQTWSSGVCILFHTFSTVCELHLCQSSNCIPLSNLSWKCA